MLLGRTQRTNGEHSICTQQRGSQTRPDMSKLEACTCWKSCNNQ
jgi:hypothetical protein